MLQPTKGAYVAAMGPIASLRSLWTFFKHVCCVPCTRACLSITYHIILYRERPSQTTLRIAEIYHEGSLRPESLPDMRGRGLIGERSAPRRPRNTLPLAVLLAPDGGGGQSGFSRIRRTETRRDPDPARSPRPRALGGRLPRALILSKARILLLYRRGAGRGAPRATT